MDKPALAGERAIWQALRGASIRDDVALFYNRRPKGSRRAPDVLWLDPQRGIINIEVKGGLVHFNRRSFHQKINRPHTKKINPWAQAQRATADLLKALDLESADIPYAVILAAPIMHRSAFTFGDSPHIITADDIEGGNLITKIEALLPVLTAPLGRIVTALSRARDYAAATAAP